MDPHSFYADPDPHPAAFLNVDPGPSPAEPNLKKKNHEKFSQVVKIIKHCLKLRNNGACENLLLKKCNKVAVISKFLAFFQFVVDKFTLLDADPDPHIECGSGSRRENECRFMRIRIHSPGF